MTNEDLVRRMMRYVAPAHFARGNHALAERVVQAYTVHFTEAVEFLYDVFINYIPEITNCSPLNVFHLWIRSLYIYTKFVEVFSSISELHLHPVYPSNQLKHCQWKQPCGTL